jgi:predicted phage tail protein
MASSGLYKSSKASVYDLISEGPIVLKDGLSSIYLNRTPIANSGSSEQISQDLDVDYPINVDGTKIFLVAYRPSDIPEGQEFPILVKGGVAESTVTASAGDTSITTAGTFFTAGMVGNNHVGGAYAKVRIVGAGPGGEDYVGIVVSQSSSTAGVLSPAIETSVTNAKITYDLVTLGSIDTSTITTFSGIAKQAYIDLDDTVTNTNLRNDLSSGSYTTWTLSNIVFYTSTAFGLYNLPDKTNFESVSVSFRSGTEFQAPLYNTIGFSNAASGIAPNVELSQVDTVENESGGTINIHGEKTTPFWATNEAASDIVPDTGGTAITITSGSGTYGLNVGTPGAVDELAFTINFPNGLYGQKADQDASKTDSGVIFQVVFKHKLSGEVNYKREVVLGPNTEEINDATSFLARNDGHLILNKKLATGVITGGLAEAASVDFRVDVSEFQPFDDFQLVISKITPDSWKYAKWTYYQQTVLTSVQAFIHDKFSYPHSAYAGIEFSANEFQGKLPQRAYHCFGVQHDLPTNYITREEADDGVAKYTRNISTKVDTGSYVPWDGTFRKGFSTNPVWNLREILVNKRWGLGNWITSSEINDYSLYSLARYCDELVPDGEGGLEPRFTCGVYLTQSTEAYKVIKDFCTIMLALPYWVDGQLILEGDRPAEPVYTFTKSNIVGGLFGYEGTGNRTRVNQIAVTYNDRNNFFETSVELIDDIENIAATNRINTEEVVAFGATSRSQAIRYGKWKMLTSKLQKEVVSFKTSENASYLKPGSIINIQDADRERVRYSGRVVSASDASTITLDSSVTLSASYDYELLLIVPGSATYLAQESATISSVDYVFGDIIAGVTTQAAAEVLEDDSGNAVTVQFAPDVHVETRALSTPSTGSTVTTSSAFTSAPNADTVWAITIKDGQDTVEGSPKQYKVLGISEDSPGVYSISAAEHYNSKFDLIDEDYLADPVDYVPRDDDIPSITQFSGRVDYDDQSASANAAQQPIPKITLNWKSPVEIVNGAEQIYTNFDNYVLKYDPGARDFVVTTIPKQSNSYTIQGLDYGTYLFSIQAVSAVGPVSTPKYTYVTFAPKEEAAGAVKQSELMQGGKINRPLLLDGSTMSLPSSYTFTSPSGRVKVVS